MRRYFSLIELLVVIAIIAILAVLILAALSPARKSGYRIACNNQMRTIVAGIHIYSDNNNDWLLTSRTSSLWCKTLWMTIKNEDPSNNALNNFFRCVAEPIPNGLNSSSGYRYTHYVLNGSLTGVNPNPAGTTVSSYMRKRSCAFSPSAALLVLDNGRKDSHSVKSDSNISMVAFRHGGLYNPYPDLNYAPTGSVNGAYTNTGYVDGHVSSTRRFQFETLYRSQMTMFLQGWRGPANNFTQQ